MDNGTWRKRRRRDGKRRRRGIGAEIGDENGNERE